MPEAPLVENTSQQPQGPLTLNVWPGSDCSGSVYADDGRSFDYRRGGFRRLSLSCEARPGGLVLSGASSGSYAPSWHELRWVVHAVPRAPGSVVGAGGAPLPHSYDASSKTLTVTGVGAAGDVRVEIRW